jgi:hypothetical protein
MDDGDVVIEAGDVEVAVGVVFEDEVADRELGQLAVEERGVGLELLEQGEAGGREVLGLPWVEELVSPGEVVDGFHVEANGVGE